MGASGVSDRGGVAGSGAEPDLEELRRHQTNHIANHGEPDLDYELVEATTAGHQLDLELEMNHDPSALQRIESRGSFTFKLSRALTRERSHATGHSKRKGADKDGPDGADAAAAEAGVLGGGNSSDDEKDSKHRLERERLPETDLDAGIVGWDGQDDPEMPLNRPAVTRWIHTAVLAAVTFLTTFASSILSPGMAKVNTEFHNDNTALSSITISIYLLGYVVGPLFIAPLSEIYGRRPVLGIANVFFCAWQLAASLAPNIASLVIFRFLGGVGGAGCMTLGGSVIGDLFRTDQRGLAMGIWNLGPMVGPTMGPLIGGFVASDIGWRWDFRIVLIIAVVFSAVLHFIGSETNPRVLIHNKVIRLRRELGRDDLHSCYAAREQVSRRRILLNGLVRPTKMLFLSPMIFSLSMYMSYVYGVLYLLLTTIPTVFETIYGFTVGESGLVYLSLGISNIIGWLVICLWSDRSVISQTRANNGRFVPEMRLAITICYGIFLPATFFWYGWCARYHVHWIIPVIGLMPFGFGMMGLMIPIITYLVDAYPMYAASALAANVVLRSLVGALLPLAGPSLYNHLGYGWGNSVLGFISISMIPVPLLIYRYGERLRNAQRFTL